MKDTKIVEVKGVSTLHQPSKLTDWNDNDWMEKHIEAGRIDVVKLRNISAKNLSLIWTRFIKR